MAPDRSDTKGHWVVSPLLVAAIWLGMLVGVSFLATPVKFLAPSLTLPVALDVGHHTFRVFNKTEWLLSVLLLGLVLTGSRNVLALVGATIAAAMVLVETVWLLPLLDSRVALIIAGQQPEPSRLHAFYIACEVAKLASLLLVIIGMARRITENGRVAASEAVHSQVSSPAQ